MEKFWTFFLTGLSWMIMGLFHYFQSNNSKLLRPLRTKTVWICFRSVFVMFFWYVIYIMAEHILCSKLFTLLVLSVHTLRYPVQIQVEKIINLLSFGLPYSLLVPSSFAISTIIYMNPSGGMSDILFSFYLFIYFISIDYLEFV